VDLMSSRRGLSTSRSRSCKMARHQYDKRSGQSCLLTVSAWQSGTWQCTPLKQHSMAHLLIVDLKQLHPHSVHRLHVRVRATSKWTLILSHLSPLANSYRAGIWGWQHNAAQHA
jgi:hypothetical protein